MKETERERERDDGEENEESRPANRVIAVEIGWILLLVFGGREKLEDELWSLGPSLRAKEKNFLFASFYIFI